MLRVRSVVVDFDGTACSHDVAEDLLIAFGDPSWPDWDAAWERGEIGSHEVVRAQAAMLRAPLDELIAFAVDHCPIDPTFSRFVEWAGSEGVTVSIASDGFGFYIPPLLATVGLQGVPVVTNTWTGSVPTIRFDNGHPECATCGTCKMLAVLSARERGRVAFVGEGASDRFGALYADVAFAKDRLAEICRADGVPSVPWNDFDDVRRALETMDRVPGPVGVERCPGWPIEPSAARPAESGSAAAP